MNAIEINALQKSYKTKQVLKDFNLNIKSGEFFGLLGQNGAGKSTIINCITGISIFNQGEIKVFDLDVQKDYQLTRAKIGLAPQEFNMDIFAPVTKILHYVGGYFGMNKKERTQRIEELLTQFDLQDHRHKEFRQLSGGLKRRLTLARAMMHDPELLILDEPTAGVDVEQRHELWRYLTELHQKGKTIILTSHYIEEVERLCSKVAILHNGNIISEIDKKDFDANGHSLESQYLKATKK